MSTPKVVRMTRRWAASAISRLAMIAIGTKGGLDTITVRSHTGASPPGAGRMMTASPPQTKLMPSVTTIEGRSRRWMMIPSAA
ncbi:hypothetical protein D3C72_2180730 [compost metagenome]